MTIIESKEVQIKKPRTEVMAFLGNLENYKQLMPDRIKSWDVNGGVADIYIEGLGKYQIGMKSITEEEVILAPVGDVPVDFSIIIKANDQEKDTRIKGAIHAKLNMMMKMMAQKPLQELIDVQVERLQNHMS